jgi:hypothetical protein
MAEIAEEARKAEKAEEARKAEKAEEARRRLLLQCATAAALSLVSAHFYLSERKK